MTRTRLHVNHFAEAERCLSQASYRRGDGPDAAFLNPESAAVLASLAQAHATLAALPNQTVAAQENVRELRVELGVMRRVVAGYIAEATVDGGHETAKWAWNLAYSLEERQLSVEDAVKDRIAGLGADPERVWVAPSEAEAEESVDTDALVRREIAKRIGAGLSSRNPEKIRAARALATAMDHAGLNVDDEVIALDRPARSKAIVDTPWGDYEAPF